jgi:cytochrome c oxidase subunit 2
VILKFRKPKGDDTDGPPIEGNVGLEIFWTAIPTVIVFILSIYSFEVYNNMGGLDPMVSHDHGTKMAHHQPASSSEMVAFNSDSKIALGLGSSPDDQSTEPPLVINVNGIQYAWIFTYPESGITSGEIHVPVNKKVELNIVAGDVIHAFWIPEFRIKQDAVPGREAQLVITPNRIGDYPIICAELCGSYHGGMKTRFVVETQENYEKWVQENTFAQADDLNKAVAINPANLSDSEFLAPYAHEMGIETTMIKPMIHH